MATARKRAGRPSLQWWTLADVARVSGRRIETLAAWLALEPSARPFFPSADLQDGVWLIPEPEVALFLKSRAEQLYTARQTAALLGLSYEETTRRIVTDREPHGSREIGGLFLGDRLRVPDSEIARLTTPTWKDSNGRKHGDAA